MYNRIMTIIPQDGHWGSKLILRRFFDDKNFDTFVYDDPECDVVAIVQGA